MTLYADRSAAPDFEHYTDAFDPHTGNGEVEMWIPIE
jgi:predicted transcriptional regulator YdeE